MGFGLKVIYMCVCMCVRSYGNNFATTFITTGSVNSPAKTGGLCKITLTLIFRDCLRKVVHVLRD